MKKKIINLLDENKGAILLFLTLVIMLNYYISEIAEIRNQEQNQVSITEKR